MSAVLSNHSRHHPYHHRHHHASFPSPQSSVASPPKRLKTMDGISEDDLSLEENENLEQEQGGKRSSLEIKREKNRIKQRNLRERRAKHIAQLESAVAQLNSVNQDLQSRLVAAESRANNLTSWVNELEAALIHRGFEHEANAIRRTWAGVSGSATHSLELQPPESNTPQQPRSRDLLSTLATAATAASLIDPSRPSVGYTHSPFEGGWNTLDVKAYHPASSTSSGSSSRWYDPSPVTGENHGRQSDNASFQTPPAYNQLPSFREVDGISQPMPTQHSVGSPYFTKVTGSSPADLPLNSHRPRYQPAPPSLTLSPLNNATSPSRLSIAELLSPVPVDGPSMSDTNGSNSDHSWPLNKPETFPSSASSSISSLVRVGQTPQSQTLPLDCQSQISQLPQTQSQIQFSPSSLLCNSVQDHQQSLSEMSMIDMYLGSQPASRSSRFPSIPSTHSTIVHLSYISENPSAASLQSARHVLSSYLPHPIPIPVPNLPEINHPHEQHSILLALSHIPLPSVAAHWQSTQLSSLPPSSSKLLLEYQTSPYADPRVCLLPIAVLRASVVTFLRQGLAIDITRLITTTLTHALVFGCTLDPDAWEMADAFWDEWEGWFPNGRSYCQSLAHWRRRDGHKGSKVAEVILGLEAPHSRREDAIGRPPDWRMPGST